MAKVHVHNERPDAVIAYGLGLGALSRITIENLDGQAHDVREAKAVAFVGEAGGSGSHVSSTAAPTVVAEADGPGADGPGADRLEPEPMTRLPLGVVAVAPSDGLAAILTDTAAPFREYGAFRIVRGGQSANPSTGELLEAVQATQADELLILPNNPNVVLAARQVASMTDRPVHIVPTRNVAEGVAALFELDGRISAAENEAAMTEAGRGLQTMQVTEAVRDADRVRPQGQEGPDHRAGPGRRAARGGQRPGPRGARRVRPPGARASRSSPSTTARTRRSTRPSRSSRKIAEAAPGLEGVDLAHGGQPHYRYLISAE